MRTLASLLFIAVSLTACGKKGPLIYPDMLVPAAPSSVAAQQTGNAMKLSFVLPSKDLAGRNFSGLASVKILKHDEPAGQAPGCSSCTADFALFRKLNLELLPSDTQRSGSLVALLDSDVQVGRSYSYRVSGFTRENQEGAVSTTAPAVMRLTPLPPVLQVICQPTEIDLEFVGLPPEEGVIAGYNIYRTVKGALFPLVPLNRKPLVENRYVDQGLDRSTSYVYGIRTVVRLSDGSRMESNLSNEAEGRLKDDE